MTAIYALGLVFVIEGLVYTLAPDYVRMLLEILQKTAVWKQRVGGLVLILFGVFLVWMTQSSPY